MDSVENSRLTEIPEDADSQENLPCNGSTVAISLVTKNSEAITSRKRPGVENESSQDNKKRKRVYIYGNYDRYYGYRNFNETPMEDVRLQSFVARKDLIAGKRMLDIGCNNGSLTLLIAQHCKPASVIGLDIDGDLIGSARRKLLMMIKTCSLDGSEKESLEHVEFRRANYVYQNEALLESEKPQFDVILCLSVTKWIHLNFGDEALKLVFKRIYRQLQYGGSLILEAQPWNSYKRRKRITDNIFEHYKKISFRPEEFNSYLMSSDIGFREMFELKVGNHATKGFSRPIFVFRK